MLLFAFISEIPFDMAFFSRYSMDQGIYPFYFGYQNVFFTLFLGLIALWCIEKLSDDTQSKAQKIRSVLLQALSVAAVASLAELLHSDYGSQGVLFIVGFYLCRKNRLYQILTFLILYMATTGNQPTVYIMVSAIFVLLYNGNRGKSHGKYFFYVFYPAHILLLYLATVVLGQVIVI